MSQYMASIKLSPAHMKKLKKTPFFNLINAFICQKVKHVRKFDVVAEELIRTYKNGKFHIGPVSLKLHSSDIKLIFGINCGDKHIDLGYTTKKMTPFVRRRFSETDKISASDIKDAISDALRGTSNNDVCDVVRLLYLYLFVTLLFTPNGSTIKLGFIKYIEDIETMVQYDWCQAIVHTLLSSVDRSNGNPKKVTGCVLALQYWLCEHINLVDPAEEDEIPRFLKWDLISLNKKFKTRPITSLELNEIKTGKLEMDPREEELYDIPSSNESLSDNESIEDDSEQNVSESVEHELSDNEKSDNDMDIPSTNGTSGDVNENDEDDDEDGEFPNLHEDHMEINQTPTNDYGNLLDSLKIENDNLKNEIEELKKSNVEYEKLVSVHKSGCRIAELKGNTIEAKLTEVMQTLKEKESEMQALIDMNTKMASQIDEYEVHNVTQEAFMVKVNDGDTAEVIEVKKQLAKVKERESAHYRVCDLKFSEKDKEIHDLKDELDDAKKINSDLIALNIALQVQIKTPKKQTVATTGKSLTPTAGLKPEGPIILDDTTPNRRTTRSMVSPAKLSETRSDQGNWNNQGSTSTPAIDEDMVQVSSEDDIPIAQLRTRSLVRGIKTRTRVLKRDSAYVFENDNKTVRRGKRVEVIEKRIFTLPCPNNFRVCKLLSQEDRDLMHRINNISGPFATVFKDNASKFVITLADLCALIEEKSVGHNVIDAFASLLLDRQHRGDIEQNNDIRAGNSCVYSSLCMKYLREKNDEGITTSLDNELRKNTNEETYRYHQYPIFSKSRGVGAEHWTMAIFDAVGGVWRFYNSLLPRILSNKDPYRPDFTRLRTYVDKYIRSIVPPGIGTQEVKTRVEIVADTPQQTDASVDCGIMVCHVMKKVFYNEPLTAKCDAATMRSEMVHSFLSTLGNSWPDN